MIADMDTFTLGVDYQRAFVNNAGRPVPILPHGEPIAELG